MPLNAVTIRNASGRELYVLINQNYVVSFGRDKNICHVAFDPQAARVSRVHASLEWIDERVVFTDKSKEGTIIEGVKIKQTSKELGVGVHNVEIGGIQITIDVEAAELDETVPSSPTSEETEQVQETLIEQNNPSTVVESVSGEIEELDDVGSMCSMALEDGKRNRKRRSDVTLFEDTQPRGKKAAVPRRQLDFDEEMENRGRKGPRARKAEDRSVFDSETPAKKKKSTWEPETSQRLVTNFFKPPKSKTSEPDVDVEVITKEVAALPSVSRRSSRSKEDMALDLEMEMHLDRGPAAPNETIKYANLVYRPPDFNTSDQRIDPTVPNFKKFKPKNAGDGRTSGMSMFSTTTHASHVTTTLVDARNLA